jgi:hypothetical protein
MHSNIKFGKVDLLRDRDVSLENSLVDMGDEVFTKGKPHPVMDPSILVDRMIQEAMDPSVRRHPFRSALRICNSIRIPVGAIEDALKEIRRIEREEGRHICVIGSLCGTDIEPQDVADQARRLRNTVSYFGPATPRRRCLQGSLFPDGGG